MLKQVISLWMTSKWRDKGKRKYNIKTEDGKIYKCDNLKITPKIGDLIDTRNLETVS